MEPVLILGGGIAGCRVAQRLSQAGIPAILVEKTTALGGKTAVYGCKAGTECSQCGLCAVNNLAAATLLLPGVQVWFGSTLRDLYRQGDGFSALISREGQLCTLACSQVVLASGFAHLPQGESGNILLPASQRIVYGAQLEELLRGRTAEQLLPETPQNLGFLLCFGSRNPSHEAGFCSRVCCSYTTRAAKLFRHYYPHAEIMLFYMDIQGVKPDCYRQELLDLGIELIRCRVGEVWLEQGYPCLRWHSGKAADRTRLDYLFLASGFRPNPDNRLLAELCDLQEDGDGFLAPLAAGASAGIVLAGTVKGPMTITETLADADAAALTLLGMGKGGCGYA